MSFACNVIGKSESLHESSYSVTVVKIYDGYANMVAISCSTSSPCQFGATSGHRSDGDTGILQVGATYYDPAVGSFLTRDTNLSQLAYVYCGMMRKPKVINIPVIYMSGFKLPNS